MAATAINDFLITPSTPSTQSIAVKKHPNSNLALNRGNGYSSLVCLTQNSNSSNQRTSARRVSRVCVAESKNWQLDAPDASADIETDFGFISEWELDFCSRPILDERGKRVWELLICDGSRTLQYAQYFPSNKINSTTLKEALVGIMESYNVPKPQKIRFFRAQMQTIISKACFELDIRPVPSQRCLALVQWLEERFVDVYSQHPGFQEGAAPLLQVEGSSAQGLPDSLRGEQWAFVQLPLSGVIEEMKRVDTREVFGARLDLDVIGLGDLSPDTMVPGVAVESTRAMPLAAWTSALELAYLSVDVQRACLTLSTGVNDRWRYAFYNRSPAADAEAKAWESAKQQCGGLHFLAVQSSLESDDCAGFWLMRELALPQI